MRFVDRPGPLLPAARRRGSVVRRLLQFVIIPVAAVVVLGWGWVGLRETPDFLTGSRDGEGRTASGGSPVALASPPVSGRLLPAASPALARSVVAWPTATPTPAPTPSPTVTPRPAVTPRPTATPSPVAIVGCALPVALPPVVDPAALATAGVVNLRERPGLGCGVALVLAPGTEVRPRSGPVGADGLEWILVDAAGASGWVATSTLTAGPAGPSGEAGASATAAPTAPGDPPTAMNCAPPAALPPAATADPVVATTNLNLRSGPGEGCAVLLVLPAGTEAVARSGPVRADDRLWVLIEVGGTSGWAAADFLG